MVKKITLKFIFLRIGINLLILLSTVAAENPLHANPQQKITEKEQVTQTIGLSKAYLEIEKSSPPRFEILINIPATLLTLYENGIPVMSYKVAVGTRRWATPTGKFHIDEIQWNPWWYPPESEWAEEAEKTPPGPSNPLYPVKLMMEDALRIHGTPRPWSIGRAASHGCMRMRRNEVRTLSEYLEAKLKSDHKATDFEKYRKKTWQTYLTKLDPEQEIWVYLVYEPIERMGNSLAIHPNLYGKTLDYEAQVLDLLMEAGIYETPLLWERFNSEKKQAKHNTSLFPFQDFLPEDTNMDYVDPSFHPVCWVESPSSAYKMLAEARQKYNTRLALRTPHSVHHRDLVADAGSQPTSTQSSPKPLASSPKD